VPAGSTWKYPGEEPAPVHDGFLRDRRSGSLRLGAITVHRLSIPVLALTLGLAGCTRTVTTAPAPAAPAAPTPAAATMQRRAFTPGRDGQPVLEGISYGPFRAGQRPGGPSPTPEQIAEDLRILAPHWGMLRVYGSREPTETILRTIHEQDLPIQVVVGAWISAPDQPDAAASDAAEVAEAIRLANTWPDEVLAVSVGNETQVAWSGHRSDRDALIGHIRTVRRAISQPVTTADDYNFWNKPESQAVADEVDFLMLHAYAMWNQQSLDDAVAWTDRTVDDIESHHPGLQVILSETGWATGLNPEGREIEHIKAPAGEAEQARFYAELRAWAADRGEPWFVFEAFDEPWKGSEDPREVEKHWGLYTVDRTPKIAMQPPAVQEPEP